VALTEARPSRFELRAFFKVLLVATLAELLIFAFLVGVHAALPAGSLREAADFAGITLSFTSIATLLAGVAYAWKGFPKYRPAILFLLLVTGSTLVAHLYIINTPSLPSCRDLLKGVDGCIMDESYYVPAAQVMLNGTQCGPGVANCNPEHPFLSKALIAAGIAAFGNAAWSWRILNVLLGTFCLPLLFVLVLRVSRSIWVASLSLALLGLDVMFFTQSSAALLDVPMVFFALLAFVLYFYNVSYWKLDRFTVAGILLGLSALSKETAIFLMATLATYHVAAGEGGRKLRLVCAAEMVVVTAGVFFLGLQAYDSLLARAAFPSFLDQIHYILAYGASLTGPGWSYGSGTLITPLSWITYYGPVVYYPSSTATYYGVTNLLETWTVYIWVPLAAYATWKVFKPRWWGLERFGFVDTESRAFTGRTKMALLSLIWFLWNYVPYVVLWIYGRVTYPFYIVPALPAVAMGASYFLTLKPVPRYVALLYVAGAFFFFFVYFPDKSFLPEWLRAAIGK
jgi:4-amino-4-deoxy-L-arabinose transferase-like glycosyltransferase